jgi:hypothetical protein
MTDILLVDEEPGTALSNSEDGYGHGEPSEKRYVQLRMPMRDPVSPSLHQVPSQSEKVLHIRIMYTPESGTALMLRL